MTVLFVALAFVLGLAAGAFLTAAAFLAMAVQTEKRQQQLLRDAARGQQ